MKIKKCKVLLNDSLRTKYSDWKQLPQISGVNQILGKWTHKLDYTDNLLKDRNAETPMINSININALTQMCVEAINKKYPDNQCVGVTNFEPFTKIYAKETAVYVNSYSSTFRIVYTLPLDILATLTKRSKNEIVKIIELASEFRYWPDRKYIMETTLVTHLNYIIMLTVPPTERKNVINKINDIFRGSLELSYDPNSLAIGRANVNDSAKWILSYNTVDGVDTRNPNTNDVYTTSVADNINDFNNLENHPIIGQYAPHIMKGQTIITNSDHLKRFIRPISCDWSHHTISCGTTLIFTLIPDWSKLDYQNVELFIYTKNNPTEDRTILFKADLADTNASYDVVYYANKKDVNNPNGIKVKLGEKTFSGADIVSEFSSTKPSFSLTKEEAIRHSWHPTDEIIATIVKHGSSNTPREVKYKPKLFSADTSPKDKYVLPLSDTSFVFTNKTPRAISNNEIINRINYTGMSDYMREYFAMLQVVSPSNPISIVKVGDATNTPLSSIPEFEGDSAEFYVRTNVDGILYENTITIKQDLNENPINVKIMVVGKVGDKYSYGMTLNKTSSPRALEVINLKDGIFASGSSWSNEEMEMFGELYKFKPNSRISISVYKLPAGTADLSASTTSNTLKSLVQSGTALTTADLTIDMSASTVKSLPDISYSVQSKDFDSSNIFGDLTNKKLLILVNMERNLPASMLNRICLMVDSFYLHKNVYVDINATMGNVIAEVYRNYMAEDTDAPPLESVDITPIILMNYDPDRVPAGSTPKSLWEKTPVTPGDENVTIKSLIDKGEIVRYFHVFKAYVAVYHFGYEKKRIIKWPEDDVVLSMFNNPSKYAEDWIFKVTNTYNNRLYISSGPIVRANSHNADDAGTLFGLALSDSYSWVDTLLYQSISVRRFMTINARRGSSVYNFVVTRAYIAMELIKLYAIGLMIRMIPKMLDRFTHMTHTSKAFLKSFRSIINYRHPSTDYVNDAFYINTWINNYEYDSSIICGQLLATRTNEIRILNGDLYSKEMRTKIELTADPDYGATIKHSDYIDSSRDYGSEIYLSGKRHVLGKLLELSLDSSGLPDHARYNLGKHENYRAYGTEARGIMDAMFQERYGARWVIPVDVVPSSALLNCLFNSIPEISLRKNTSFMNIFDLEIDANGVSFVFINELRDGFFQNASSSITLANILTTISGLISPQNKNVAYLFHITNAFIGSEYNAARLAVAVQQFHTDTSTTEGTAINELKRYIANNIRSDDVRPSGAEFKPYEVRRAYRYIGKFLYSTNIFKNIVIEVITKKGARADFKNLTGAKPDGVAFVSVNPVKEYSLSNSINYDILNSISIHSYCEVRITFKV